MATFIETLGILNFFAPLFAALLVFAVVFAVLSQTKILGSNKVVQGIVSIVLALLVLIYPDLINLINFIAPWFVILFIFLVLLLVLYHILGVSEGDIVSYMKTDRTISWVVLAFGLIILIGGIFSVFGQRALDSTSGVESNVTQSSDVSGSGFNSNLFATIFSPKILGFLLVMGIAVFTVAFLGGKSG